MKFWQNKSFLSSINRKKVRSHRKEMPRNRVCVSEIQLVAFPSRENFRGF